MKHCHIQLEMGYKGGQVFSPVGFLWLKIDGNGTARSISDRPLLFDKKASDEGRPNDGGIIEVQRTNDGDII